MKILEVGDLVHVIADNCDQGLGIIMAIDEHMGSFSHRVLTSDGRCLHYFPFELHEPKWREDETR